MAKQKLGPPVSKGVTQGRTDMGVDYSGTGHILAVQDGVVTYIGNATGSAHGGNGPFMIYKTAAGYVYVAEQWTPLVKVGQHIKQGAVIGRMSGGGIEMGWAAGPTGSWNTLAAPHYSEGQVTAEGKSFAAAVAGKAFPSTGPNAAPAAASQAPASVDNSVANQPSLSFPQGTLPDTSPNPLDTVPQPQAPGSEFGGLQGVAQAWQQIAQQPMASPDSQSFAQQLSQATGA